MTRDICPTCREDVSREAFDRDLSAGAELECPGCGERLRVGENHDGWHSYYTFKAITSEGPRVPSYDQMMAERKAFSRTKDCKPRFEQGTPNPNED